MGRIFGTLLLLCGLMCLDVGAAVVYTCDFEDPSECAQWQLNCMERFTTLENKWYIGAPGHFGLNGNNGLYISSDADSSRAVYSATQQMVALTYRDLTLSAGQYTLIFDYQIGGNETARFSVWWLPQSVRISSVANMLAPDWTVQDGVRIVAATYSHHPWCSSEYTFYVPDSVSDGRLVFVWESMPGVSAGPSACIDNIVLFHGPLCAVMPTELSYDRGTGEALWSGEASAYELMLYNTDTGILYPTDTISSTQCSLIPETEGHYRIYVRSLCEEGYSAWAIDSAFIYIKGLRCIDYMDIGGSQGSRGVCYVGDFDTFIRYSGRGTMGLVDKGASDPTSTHALHTDVNEYDMNTRGIDGGLKTIPDGEIVSVRLGQAYMDTVCKDIKTSKFSGKSARIEYKYDVETGVSDLLDLRYACVLQAGNHGWSINDPDMQPTFSLEVLNDKGQPLDSASSDCTDVYFLPGFGDTKNWHNDDVTGNKDGAIYWCDWDSITISLRRYVGKTLTIRLTATRCTKDYHYAYAYFTVGCRDGSLEGVACDDYSTEYFEAPAGFNYEWYKVSDPDSIVSREQQLHISLMDTCVYVVRVISPVVDGCFYELVANPNPPHPHAECRDSLIQHDGCSNIVTFSNHAYVSTVNRVTYEETVSDEALESVWWDFGDGTEETEDKSRSVQHIFPQEGGTFHVRQVAVMKNGMCTDTAYLEITLPDVTQLESVDSIVHACIGDDYSLPAGGGTVYADTVYEWTTENRYGCTVDNRLDIRFHEKAESVRFDTICDGMSYMFEGVEYREPGTYPIHYLSQYGCDSVLTLELAVLDRLSVSFPDDTIFVCADDKELVVPYDVLYGMMGEEAYISFDKDGVDAGFLPAYVCVPMDVLEIPIDSVLRAGYYPMTIEFASRCVSATASNVVVAVRYASTVMESMDGLVALYNSKYNGGYEWTAYQWYCDGEELAGETRSFVVLDNQYVGSSVYCVVTREDGVVIATCPIEYDAGSMDIEMTGEETDYQWYDILGRPVEEPVESGVYIRVNTKARQTQKILR